MIKSILGGKSKNLFQLSDEVGVLDGGLGPNVARNFEENKWYVGLTSNNYYIPSNITEYSIKDDLIYFKRDNVNSNGYGLARAIKCEPSIIYTLSFEPIYDAEYYAINIGYFDKDGNLISTNNIAGTSKTITTPNNCNWLVLVFNFYDIYGSGKGELYFGYIQLELGSTATEYVPHELTSYKSIMKVSDIMQVVNKPVSNTGMSLVGKSITKSGITCHYLEDGTGVTLTGTTSTAHATFEFGVYKKPIIGHKYLWFYQHSNASDVINTAYIELKYIDKDGKGHWFNGIEQVYTLSEYAEKFEFHPIVKVNTTCNGFTFKPQLFDLTEMFGAGNEPKTVAEFKAKFPNDYYPYSPSCFVTSFDERMPCKTKNLFSSSTEVGTLEGGFGGPTVARNFEENKWYQGFATNGYYGPWNVPDFDIHPNSLYVYSNGAGYGMSRAIKCEPNTNYFISCSYSHISGGNGNVYIGYFDEGGNFISNSNIEMKYQYAVTTPSNCKWLIINFTTQGVGKVYFSDIQLVKGTIATDYVPYGYV